MRPLVIGEAELNAIADLKYFATKHPMSHEAMMKAANGQATPIGDNPNFSIVIPHGYRVVYSHEMQKGRLAQHISISVSAKSKYANVEAVNLIIKSFGFKGKMPISDSNTFFWLEEEVCAVNVLEFL